MFSRTRPSRFTNTVRDAREAENISAEDLAEYCKVTPETIEEIEAGKYEPSVVLAEHIARKLRRTVEELFAAKEPVAPNSATDEERIGAVVHRRTYNLMLASILIALSVAFALQFFDGYDQVRYTAFAFWALGSIAYLATNTVWGSVRLNQRIARAKGKKQAIRDTVFMTVWYAVAMSVFGHFMEPERSIEGLFSQWGLAAIFFGVMMYFTTYGRRWRDEAPR